MAKIKVQTSKGYDPYNKPTATKPKPKPSPYKAGPNNPYNNAGRKIAASSTRAGGDLAAAHAGDREILRSMLTKGSGPKGPGVRGGRSFTSRMDVAGDRGSAASSGMMRKNAAKKAAVDAARKARPSKIGWAKASGAKAKGSMVKWGTAGAKKAAPKMLGGFAKGIAAAAGRALGPISAVATAGQAGYMVGTALNKKFNISGRIVDKFAPKYNPNAKTPAKKRK